MLPGKLQILPGKISLALGLQVVTFLFLYNPFLYNKNMSISFVHSFTDWIFMSTYYMPSMILGTGNSEVNQKGKFSALMELNRLMGETDSQLTKEQ